MQNPPPGIAVELVDESDLFRWRVLLDGPEGSPYQVCLYSPCVWLSAARAEQRNKASAGSLRTSERFA